MGARERGAKEGESEGEEKRVREGVGKRESLGEKEEGVGGKEKEGR